MDQMESLRAEETTIRHVRLLAQTPDRHDGACSDDSRQPVGADCNASCAENDRDCMANHAGGGVNVQAIMDMDCDLSELQAGTCAACLPGGVGGRRAR